MYCRVSLIAAIALLSLTVSGQQRSSMSKAKKSAIKYIDDHSAVLTKASDSIWSFAEGSFMETKSAQLIKDILRREGFRIEENVLGLPTVFVATYGDSRPVIGLYGEYDADAGASNKVTDHREEVSAGANGHGGSHNLLGVGSLGAALAIKDLIAKKKLTGTIRYYGSTAEGTMGARSYLARDGYFNDLDLSLYWHPAPVTWASTGIWDAVIDVKVLLAGRSSDFLKEDEGSTHQALELFIQKMGSLRSTLDAETKFNYSIQEPPHALHQVPDSIILGIRIQSASQQSAVRLFNGLKGELAHIAEKTKVSAGVSVERAMHQFLPNVTAMKAVHANMELLGEIRYNQTELDFVKQVGENLKLNGLSIQDNVPAFNDASKAGKLYGYSSDIGDASWIAPEIYFIVKSLPPVNMHHWQGTIFSGHSIGHKGMLHAAKLMAMTIVDYMSDKDLQQSIRTDFETAKDGYKYVPIIGPGKPDAKRYLKAFK